MDKRKNKPVKGENQDYDCLTQYLEAQTYEDQTYIKYKKGEVPYDTLRQAVEAKNKAINKYYNTEEV